MLEQKLIDEITAAWEFDQNFPGRKRKKKPLPVASDIKEILDKCFLASLKREEEKPITFCLAYLNKNDVESETKATSYKQLIVTFKKEIPLSVDGITKISPAFDPSISALAVGKTKDTEDIFSIWGGMFFGSSLNRFNEIPVSLPDHIFSRPDIFTVTAKSPGSLTISRGNSQIGILSSGYFTKANLTPFTPQGLGGYLEKNIQGMKGFNLFKHEFLRLYVDALEYLLTQSSKRGHGSTIVILPNGNSEVLKLPITQKYRFSESLNIEDLIYETVINMHGANKITNFIGYLAYKKKLAERLDFLAQLSAIDGALVILPNFDVVAFGSTLRATTTWKGLVLTGSDGFGGGGQRLDLSRYGTRHNSAIDFVASCPGSIAFVISQDGPIKGFVIKDKDTILCWPDCTASMFI